MPTVNSASVNQMQYFSGTESPWTTGATPNSVYSHINKFGKVIQNAIYDASGDVIAHIDFKPHSSAPSGHGHLFSVPGNPGTGHGTNYPHYPPGYFPAEWYRIPTNTIPHTSIGDGRK